MRNLVYKSCSDSSYTAHFFKVALIIALVLCIVPCASAYVEIKGTFPDGEVGKKYESIGDVKITGADCSWEIIKGKLPKGLTLEYFNYEEGFELSGTPEKAGNHNFTIKATELIGSDSYTKSFTIEIKGSIIDEILHPRIKLGHKGEIGCEVGTGILGLMLIVIGLSTRKNH